MLGTVLGAVNYLGEMREHPVGYTHDRELGNFNLEPHQVQIRSLRSLDPAGSLEREGCTLLSVPIETIEGEELASVAERHAARVVESLRELTRADKIISTPPLLRYSRPLTGSDRTVASYVHCDWTEGSFRTHIDRELEGEPDKDRWKGTRRAILQTWVALSPPPQDIPLAVLNRSTMHTQDLVDATVMVGPEGERRPTDALLVRYNPAHEWLYVPSMTLSDVLVFVGFDGARPEIPGNPHTAFMLPQAADSTPRISYETRASVFWND
jgi:hypothetical protein